MQQANSLGSTRSVGNESRLCWLIGSFTIGPGQTLDPIYAELAAVNSPSNKLATPPETLLGRKHFVPFNASQALHLVISVLARQRATYV